MKVRRLNTTGIEQFERFFDSLTDLAPLAVPIAALASPETSESLGVELEVEPRSFASRMELGSYLSEKLNGSGLLDINADRGLWAWLALFYFESLCPADSVGRRKPGDRARWILDPHNFQRYYRHLLAGPYRIVSAYAEQPEIAMCILCGAPDKPGDLVEQLASRQELVTNRAIIGVATRLYYDAGSGKLKRGAGGKGRGSPRRLADVLQQFDVTFDLYSLDADELSRLLPTEFDRFLPTKNDEPENLDVDLHAGSSANQGSPAAGVSK
jgi:hypothetical protein